MTTTRSRLRILPAAPGDAGEIAQLDGLSTVTTRLLREDLARDDRCCLIATWSSDPAEPHATRELPRIVGYAAAIVRLGESQLLDVAVDPAARRRGVATALLEALEVEAGARGARATTLEVAADNHAAQALYRRLGFVVEGRRPAYYPDGQDALIMWRREAATEGE